MKQYIFTFVIGMLFSIVLKAQTSTNPADENQALNLADAPSAVQTSITKVLNQTRQLADEVHLSNPYFKTHFLKESISISPRGNNLVWQWQLKSINGSDAVVSSPLLRETERSEYVDYNRGNITERYVFHGQSIEQQFVIATMPTNKHITIEGHILTEGTFHKKADHWLWANDKGSIRLGDLYVYDANGEEIKASFEVADNMTRIHIDEEALAVATFPVTIDPEIGPDDFRISFMGPNGNANLDASQPAVAYNSTDDQYLVVWQSDDNVGGLVNDEFEIFSQLVDADGTIDSTHVRISFMGGTGNSNFDAFDADVAYSETNNNYLAVWSGDSTANGRFGIWGQFIDNLGQPVGNNFLISNNDLAEARNPKVASNSTNDEYCIVFSQIGVPGKRIIRGNIIDAAGVLINSNNISSQGGNFGEEFDSQRPAVVHNSQANEYLVVWDADDDEGALVNGELEIYGQRLDELGEDIGDNFRISDMANDGQAQFDGLAPEAAYNAQDNEYLVVWKGNDNNAAGNEIFGQLLDASGSEIGQNDFQISDQDFNPTTLENFPSASYSAVENRYVVIWDGNDRVADAIEPEVYGFIVDATGLDHPSNGFRISEIGPTNNTNFTIRGAAIAYNETNGQFLTAWGGEDTGTDGELEIFGQLLDLQQPLQQFRISDMGPTGNDNFDARDPSVAYNSIDDEYLVVWAGDDNTGNLVDEEFEIYGQLLTAEGFEIDADFRISDMGPNGNSLFDALDPSIAYNSIDNDYLIVWHGDDNTGNLVDDELEIYGQLISSVGTEIGTNDFRISSIGVDGDQTFDAVEASIAYNITDNNYLVVWEGDHDVANNDEIFGQLIDANGIEIGPNDFLISDMGPNGNPAFFADRPSVAYNSQNNNFLVVWEGDDNTGLLVNEEFEIYGQLIDSIGNEIGPNDFRISDMGPDGNSVFDAIEPSVAYNAVNNNYLVVWEGDDNTGLLVDGEFEIFGQLISATGNEFGANDFRISDMGSDGFTALDASDPSVAYNAVNNNYLVVWEGDDNSGEFEIFGQLISAAGMELGANDFRISNMGPNGNGLFDAAEPSLVFNPTKNSFLVVWVGDDDIRNLVDNEFEIYGELIHASALLPCEFVLDDVQIGSPIATGLYQASDTISSSGLIPIGNDVIFDAGAAVDLLPDFEVELGAVFEVLLDGCD